MQVGPTSLNVQNRGLSLGVEHPGSLNDRIMVGFPPENEIHHNFSFEKESILPQSLQSEPMEAGLILNT